MDSLLMGLRAAAEPTRLRILALCAHAELTVSDLTQILGQSQPRVSRHLKLLVDADLLEREREGAFAFYRLAREGAGGALAAALVDLIPDDDRELALDLERLQAIKDSRAEAAAEYFRRNAGDWHRLRSLHVDDAEVEKALLALLPQAAEDLLDIGTGTGRMLELLAPRFERALGIDQSREMLAVARAGIERAGLRNVTVRLGDMYQLPVGSGSMDAVVIHQVLHYAEQPGDAVAEAARVLKPGGVLVIADFAPHGEDSLRRDHAHRWLGFADAEIARWCRAAGLMPEPPVLLAGHPLTVAVWRARRAADASPRLTALTGGRP